MDGREICGKKIQFNLSGSMYLSFESFISCLLLETELFLNSYVTMILFLMSFDYHYSLIFFFSKYTRVSRMFDLNKGIFSVIKIYISCSKMEVGFVQVR